MKLRILPLTAALWATACGPGPAAAPPDPTVPIDVQRLAARPRLTVVRRDGDPRAALALAAASPSGAAAHVGLAAVLERRLADRDARATGDAIGIRLSLTLDDDEDLEALLVDLVAALQTPIAAGEIDPAATSVEALRRRPLDAPALAPIVACTGEASALAEEAGPPTAARLEKARARLAVDEMALAYVGPIRTDLSAALAASGGWPRGDAHAAAWPRPSHGAYVSATLPAGDAAAFVALRVPDASAAVAAAQRLGEPSPLSHKIALLDPPFHLVSVGATAHPRGGCLHAQIAPTEPLVVEVLPRATALAVAQTEAELAAEARRGGPAFHTTREILAAGAARDTAERAAWWALHEPASEPPVAVSALGVGVGRDSGELDDATLTEAYVRALAPPPEAPEVDVRTRIEPGQGELWMLAASPCALRHEELWDAGLAALAASAAAAQSPTPGVTVRPWVSPAGVGLLAHGAPLRPGEAPAELAERVGDALGRAVSALPRDPAAFGRAQSTILTRLSDERSLGLFALATRIAPRHPSWIAPWGARATQASQRQVDAMLRWRTLLEGPWRIAVIANHDEAQAAIAAAMLSRWLPPTTEGCGETAGLEPFRPGTVTFAGSTANATFLVAADARGGSGAAALVAAALEGELLTEALGAVALRHEARLVGGDETTTLVVMVETPPERRDEVKRRLEALFSRLAAAGLTEASLSRARGRAPLAHPAERLAAVFRGATDRPEASLDDVRAWARAQLAPSRLAWAHDE